MGRLGRYFFEICHFVDRLLGGLLFHFKHIHYGSIVFFGVPIIVGSEGRIVFGDNVILRSGIRSNPLGGTSRIVISLEKGSELIVGNNVGISNSCFHISKYIHVGDNVLIGGDCRFYDSDMHSVDYDDRINLPDKHIKSKGITIGSGAWIGAHTLVLKGVTIGQKSVVAAGSVVTRDIPPNELWGGCPAHFIKRINTTT